MDDGYFYLNVMYSYEALQRCVLKMNENGPEKDEKGVYQFNLWNTLNGFDPIGAGKSIKTKKPVKKTTTKKPTTKKPVKKPTTKKPVKKTTTKKPTTKKPVKKTTTKKPTTKK